MGKCPLCLRRAGKRSCPAKAARICSVCCGTKREIEIDCPGDCVHLQQGFIYEGGRGPQPEGGDALRFTQQFVQRHGGLIMALARAVLEERQIAPEIVDPDVLEAYGALGATMKTLSAGIYYDTVPSAGPSGGLYRRLKAVLEEWMRPGQLHQSALRASDAIEVLEFMRSTVRLHSSGRPRSRRYLEWLRGLLASGAPQTEAPRLIVP